MKAITIKQPYASLIVNNIKKFEYRTWRTKYRGEILIHAGASSVKEELHLLGEIVLVNSRVVGSVFITDCNLVTDELDPYVGYYAWKLENPKIINSDIKVTGKLSFFDIEKY